VPQNRPLLARLGMVFLAAIGLAFDTHCSAFADAIVYQNDFDAKVGTAFPEWSSSRITSARRGERYEGARQVAPPVKNTESPRGQRRFLGEFGGPRIDPTAHTRVTQTVRLALDKLPPHASVTLSFDLLILKSWDGDSPQYGPDRWSVRAGDGPVLLDATFSNNLKVDSDGSTQSYPEAGSRPQSGAKSANTLGYQFFGDSIYSFTFTFEHKAPTLVLNFSSDLFEGKGTDDESWGLDNVTVSVRPAEEHAAAAAAPIRPSTALLRVAGTVLQDAPGHSIRLQGVNIPSMEWSNTGNNILRSVDVAMRDWHANAIRLPLAQDRWFGKAQGQTDEGRSYRTLVDQVVERVADGGGYTILDLHWSDGGVWGQRTRQHKMPDDNTLAFWEDAARRYANHPSVLFDLYNEPHDVSWKLWKRGGDVTEKDEKTKAEVTYKSPGMQRLLDAVREAGANNVVVAGGLDWAYDLSGIAKGSR
jgi:hypothetical protein